jgi:hypothetical protein
VRSAGRSVSVPPVIRLRSLLERGLTHPVLGPVILVALVIVLAMVFLHFAEDSHEASFGTACLALAAFLGSILLTPIVQSYRGASTSVRSNRGPPAVFSSRRPRLVAAHDPPLTLPLRR